MGIRGLHWYLDSTGAGNLGAPSSRLHGPILIDGNSLAYDLYFNGPVSWLLSDYSQYEQTVRGYLQRLASACAPIILLDGYVFAAGGEHFMCMMPFLASNKRVGGIFPPDEAIRRFLSVRSSVTTSYATFPCAASAVIFLARPNALSLWQIFRVFPRTECPLRPSTRSGSGGSRPSWRSACGRVESFLSTTGPLPTLRRQSPCLRREGA